MAFALGWPGYAAVFGLVLLAAGGIGHMLSGGRECFGTSALRRLAGELVIGTIAWTALFGLLAVLRTPSVAANVLLALFGLAGLSTIADQIRREPRSIWLRLALAGVLSGVMLVAGLVPVNPGADDPTNYGYIAATLFREDWVSANLSNVPNGSQLADLSRLGMLTRAPAVALLWPVTVLGWGVDARSVTGVAAWLIAASSAVLVDLLDLETPLLARIALAAGAIGAFNAMAVLESGQINQAYAIAVAVSAVWLWHWLQSVWLRSLVLVLTGVAITAGYPEFLLAVPLYFLGLLAVRPHTTRYETLIAVGSIAAGFGVVEVCSTFAIRDYLLGQSATAPAWWPLSEDPQGLADEWRAILLQRLPPRLTLVLLVPAIWYGWRIGRDSSPARMPKWTVAFEFGALAALTVIWSWVMTHAPNVNYVTFKIAGWLGPGLVLLAWFVLRTHAPRAAVRPIAALLLALAVYRSAALAAEVYFTWPDYIGAATSSPTWQLQATDRGCVVTVGSGDYRSMLAALGKSAAPQLGCRLVVAQ